MKKVTFRFYEELNDYLPADKQKVWFEFYFLGRVTVLDAIQSMDIPLEEIDFIQVNGFPKRFDYLLQSGDRIAVYPEFELFDVSGVSHLRENPLRKPVFVCDVHLGKLSKFLRMLGFDSLYSNRFTPEEMIVLSQQEKRIILSKNIRLTKNRDVSRSWLIRSSNPVEQIKNLVSNFDLAARINPLTRCLNCNSKLVHVEKDVIVNQLQAKTIQYYTEFFQCSGCNKIYWKGSHYEKMLQFIGEEVIGGKLIFE
ncbi:MAG: Mut7-C RNAse domain-containing protein [Prolixibacteraceae bacterium]